jgi:Leucine-rich repeat (LRR) protein
MLKVVRDLAIQIAKDEEYVYSCVGNGLEELQISSEIKRIFLSSNNLSSLQQFFSSPQMFPKMCSLLISQNTELTKIPKKVIVSMLSLKVLKVLDLSGTSASSLPENMGSLKQLICLKLSGMPIKGLPKSLRDLGHLEILDLSFSEIKELPSDIHMLRSLRYLGLSGCKYLQNLPYSISSLTSLQYLYMDGCTMWKEPTRNRCKRVASIQSLGDLIQLRKLALQIDWEEAIGQGTLGSMTEMDTLLLILPKMKSLPLDINNMSKLRSLSLKCSELTEMDSFKCSSLTEMENKMKNDVTNFKHLSYLKFYECAKLKDFQHLHKLQNLRHLEIILCPEVKKFPQEFGEKEAFPRLKILSLVGLKQLVELPEIKEGAMSSLEIFNMMDCPILKILPQTYLNLGIKIRVYGCPELEGVENRNLVQVVAMERNTEQSITRYLQVRQKKEDWLYGEFWCNELFLYVEGRMPLA